MKQKQNFNFTLNSCNAGSWQFQLMMEFCLCFCWLLPEESHRKNFYGFPKSQSFIKILAISNHWVIKYWKKKNCYRWSDDICSQCRLIVSQMSNTRCEVLPWILLPVAAAATFSYVLPSYELEIMYFVAIFALAAHIHYGTCVVRIFIINFSSPTIRNTIRIVREFLFLFIVASSNFTRGFIVWHFLFIRLFP